MATHFSILAWEIPWTEESDRLSSIGSQKSHIATKPPPNITHWWYNHTVSAYFIISTISSVSPPVIIILLDVSIILNPSLFFSFPISHIRFYCIIPSAYISLFKKIYIYLNETKMNIFNDQGIYTSLLSIYCLINVLKIILKYIECIRLYFLLLSALQTY